MGSIKVNINYLGFPLDEERIDLLQSERTDQLLDFERMILESFFSLPVKHLPRDVLDRYCKVSARDLYTPILPVSDKLFERLLSPLRSAKKCFCLAEYIAAIELAAHVAEMLALLIWQITPVSRDGARIAAEFEKGLWGCKFEKLGQEHRVRVLRTFNAISERQAQLFDHIRRTRARYFHLWSASTENIQADALTCFKNAAELVKETLQIEMSKSQRGAIKINPLLAAYLKTVVPEGKPGT